MKVIETIHRPAVTVEPEVTVVDVARLMEDAGVGAVAVVDHGVLVGIVTDRDLVRRVLARDVAANVRIDSVMSMPVVTIDADADLHEAYGIFRTHAVRRLAVMRGNQVMGVIAIDDLLIYIVADLSSLSQPVTAEILFGHHEASVPATVATSGATSGGAQRS